MAVVRSLVAPEDAGITDAFRVEGPGNARLTIGDAGDVSISGVRALFLNFGDEGRAEEFLARRLEQGYEGTAISHSKFQTRMSLRCVTLPFRNHWRSNSPRAPSRSMSARRLISSVFEPRTLETF
jgi:hypothetical protein